MKIGALVCFHRPICDKTTGMTADEFREIALSFSGAEERSHMDHPDFRVGGKIFASLGPGEAWAMAKLTPEQQQSLIRTDPRAFAPASGKWGDRGATIISLEIADENDVRFALDAAFLKTRPTPVKRRVG